MSIEGGRPESGRSPRCFRLKRSIEVFPDPDGAIQFGHDGLGRYFRVETPTASDRALLELLADGFSTRAELSDRLSARGLDAASLDDSLRELRRLGLIETREGGSCLHPVAAERFDRQLIYLADICDDEEAEQLQLRLSTARVVVLGCGGLGSWAACGLACAGVGDLTLVDYDTIELSNLNRQILFSETDLGRYKVDVAAESLAAIDSGLTIRSVRQKVGSADDVAELIRDADLLVGTADWPPHELPRWINRACLEAGVPHITAGQFPPLIRVGPMVVPGRSACLECQERAAERDYPLYRELADFRSSNPATASTLGAASGMIGSMIAMEGIHLLTGKVEPASVNRVLVMDLRTMSMDHEPVERHPGCACAVKILAA